MQPTDLGGLQERVVGTLVHSTDLGGLQERVVGTLVHSTDR